MQFASIILILHELKKSILQLYQEKQLLQEALLKLKKNSPTIGLVPTMGALHEGHLALIREAKAQSDVVVVSIFVNPTQFNNPADLDKYPRTLDEDLKLLKQNFKGLIVFSPTINEVYGNRVSSEKFEFGNLAQQMEGKYRDGHFDGVGTILKKLFNIVQPDKAFFGEKDYQQLLIVKKLVEITGQNIKIIGCPISREDNGLARSSRNKRLSAKELEESTFIFKILNKAKAKFGTKNVQSLKQEMEEEFKNQSLLELEYFEISNADTLEPAIKIEENKKYRAFVAAYAHNVRLIDNIALN